MSGNVVSAWPVFRPGWWEVAITFSCSAGQASAGAWCRLNK